MSGGVLMSPILKADRSTAGVRSQSEPFDPAKIEAIVFDTIGTLVDPYGTIVGEGSRITRARGVEVDWDTLFADWNAEWRRRLDEIISGVATWRSSDVLYREALDKILARYEWAVKLTEDDRNRLNRSWYALKPWNDTKPGMERLRNRFVLSALSNGSMASVISFSKQAKLPFDCILTGELVQSGKPDPKVYALAARSLNLRPDQILMVAAHKYDLAAAHAFGFRVAFIPRPFENGPHGKFDATPEDYYITTKSDLISLAEALGT